MSVGLINNMNAGRSMYYKGVPKAENAADRKDFRAFASQYERSTGFTDPNTNEVVPVNIKYVTDYSDKGISCSEYSRIGAKENQRELWSILYKNESDREKVNDFISDFLETDRLTFASQKDFWQDFLDDKVDPDDFKHFFSSAKDGVVDFVKEKNAGRSLREVTQGKYEKYLNNASFVGHVYTEDELQPSWYRNGRINIQPIYDPSVPTEVKIQKEADNLAGEIGDSSIEESRDTRLKGLDVKDLYQQYMMESVKNRISLFYEGNKYNNEK